ncbi:RidA family protein [Pelosinus baikalensis]|uniref:RidA family protein n=1 Tax=Pelosinus baikalensis TaxID=2892015 RepID=A0ABS8HRW8_9FIRM|nr:RidA family protein [Pelosinus baikalensis]MCC5465921.1 RidA family protein [Pelosinus baikalensis]
MKEIIRTSKAPEAIGAYSQAVKVGDFLFASGQIPIDPQTGNLIEGGIEAQTKQVMENVKHVLQAGGSDLDNVIKTTIYILKMEDFSVVNQVYGTYFTKNLPARSCVAVASLPKEALVEIEVVGYCRQ